MTARVRRARWWMAGTIVVALSVATAQAPDPPKSGTTAADFARFVLYAPDDKSGAGVARACKLDRARVQDGLFGRLGNP